MKTSERTSNLINRTDWKISLSLSPPLPEAGAVAHRRRRSSGSLTTASRVVRARLCKADIMLPPPPPPLATVQYIPYCILSNEQANDGPKQKRGGKASSRRRIFVLLADNGRSVGRSRRRQVPFSLGSYNTFLVHCGTCNALRSFKRNTSKRSPNWRGHKKIDR